jgi:hypothetical protein
MLPAVFNFAYAFWVLKRQVDISPEFANAFLRYKKPVIFFYFLSFAKANITSVLSAGMFVKKTGMFDMFWPHEIVVKFRYIAVVRIFIEDIPQ